MTKTAATCVLDCRDHLGEGAMWDDRAGVLWWVDVPMPALIHRLDPASGRHDRWEMPEMVMSLAVREKGGLIVASHHGINTFDPEDGKLRRILAPEKDLPRNRSNDGAPDAKGRFWYGSMQNNIAPDGSPMAMDASSGILWRIDPDRSVHKMAEGIGISNTLAWSPDWRTFYFADTMTGWIFAWDFDLDAGTIANRREFARDPRGWPDGSTIDAEGYLWNARWDGACVIRFAPDGSVDRIVELPVDKVTSCAFGGPDLATLYITTSRYTASADDQRRQPQAGSLFTIDPGVRGLPRPRFAG
jgi:sugar lactone lactonase YvrE